MGEREKERKWILEKNERDHPIISGDRKREKEREEQKTEEEKKKLKLGGEKLSVSLPREARCIKKAQLFFFFPPSTSSQFLFLYGLTPFRFRLGGRSTFIFGRKWTDPHSLAHSATSKFFFVYN